jgi:hypothetical protein
MGFRNEPVDLEYDDDEMLDRAMGQEYEPSSYPANLRFTICEADLEKAGGTGGSIGDTMPFSAMGEVTSVHASTEGNRVELVLKEFAGEDGHFFDLESCGYISLCDFELGKLGLDCDCDVGDTIHLIGEARLESVSRSDYGELATLQATKLTFEDESDESRDQE